MMVVVTHGLVGVVTLGHLNMGLTFPLLLSGDLL